MALDKKSLVNEIVKAFKRAEKRTSTNRDKVQLEIAKDLANAIENYVKSGTVITEIEGTVLTDVRTTVRTTGTSFAQTGTGNGSGDGRITSGTGTGRIT